MKGLSLKQPFASLVACGSKTIETRKWKTSYRGTFLVISSQDHLLFKHLDIIARNSVMNSLAGEKIINGAAIAMAEIYDCVLFTKEMEQSANCKLYPGYGFILRNIRRIEPIPLKGALNFFEVEKINPNFNTNQIKFL